MSEKDLFGELDQKPEQKSKELIEVNEDWPFWQRFAANVVNLSPMFLWAIAAFLIMWYFGGNPELVGLRNAYLNLVVPASVWAVTTLIAGVGFFAWLFPYFNYRKTMRTGTPIEKACCMVLYGLIAIALALVIGHVV